MTRDSATSHQRDWKHISNALCCLLAAVLFGSTIGSAQSNGRDQIALAQPLTVTWRYESDKTSNLPPAADTSTVFLPLAAGVLVALNATDGKLHWKAEAGGEFSAAPIADERR